MVGNISMPPLVPDGTLIASGVSSIYNLGANGVGSYQPEQILFRCSPDLYGQLYEFFSTNGDNPYSGMDDWAMSAYSGVPNTYATYMQGMIFRVTNVKYNVQLNHLWQSREISGTLDRDSRGWLLVKAKNFSSYMLELFQCSQCPAPFGASNASGAQTYTYPQPFAYVAFRGGYLSRGLDNGDNHRYVFDGWFGYWPGAISPTSNIAVRRASTCAVTNVTPLVFFPTLTTAELANGATSQRPITIEMRCQLTATGSATPFASGTGLNQTALGIRVQPENALTARNLRLTTPGQGVTYLLSNGYGTDPDVATGVGVALSRPNGASLNFLTNENITGAGAVDGWYPVLVDAVRGTTSNGITSYTRTINATFRAIAPGSRAITAGRYRATAQVFIRVQ
ncbi:MAG: fimbrial protein [Cupriavidus sp.]|nr:fimbrial protein [Cupriavidus sp.]